MNGIEIKNLKVNLDTFFLYNVSMNVPQGTIMGFIGRNGAGKSTLIKTINNAYPIVSGSIKINGNSFEDNREKYFTDMVTVFDELLINEQLTLKKVAQIAKKAYKVFDEKFYFEKLKHFEINTSQKIAKLSLGMKKKFNIIFNMSKKPSVLILDEPTSGIDPADRVEILEMLLDFIQDETHTVLLSTHITEDLDKIADYITLIDDGAIKFSEEKDCLSEKYRLVLAAEDTFSQQEMKSLIGIKKNSFGIEALTEDKTLWNKAGVTANRPTTEDIMIHFSVKERN